MKYKDIIKTIAKREKTSVKAIEKEMKWSIKAAGLNCSPEKFINEISQQALKTIYSKSYNL